MTNNKTAMQLLSMIRNGGNPQQLVLSMLSQSAGNNPVLQNLLSMAQQGKGEEVEKIARNLLASQGYDFDKEFNAFRQDLGL